MWTAVRKLQCSHRTMHTVLGWCGAYHGRSIAEPGTQDFLVSPHRATATAHAQQVHCAQDGNAVTMLVFRSIVQQRTVSALERLKTASQNLNLRPGNCHGDEFPTRT